MPTDESSAPIDPELALELYQRQLDQVSRQIELIQGLVDDLGRARRALEGLGEEKTKEVLVPLGASAFVKGEIKDRDTIIVGIGAGYATEKTRAETLKRYEERENQARQELERMMQTALQIQNEAATVQERFTASAQ